MEMTLNSNFYELNNYSLTLIDGGINWGNIWNGVAIIGSTALFIATAPVSIPIVAGAIGAAASGAAAGYFIGSGLVG